MTPIIKKDALLVSSGFKARMNLFPMVHAVEFHNLVCVDIGFESNVVTGKYSVCEVRRDEVRLLGGSVGPNLRFDFVSHLTSRTFSCHP